MRFHFGLQQFLCVDISFHTGKCVEGLNTITQSGKVQKQKMSSMQHLWME